jgi:hypothetical protein
MSQTYEGDILAWSEHQAELLRRIAAGEIVNSAELDWLNIAEEVESVGRSELRACEGLLRQALVHMLKMRVWPDSPAFLGWEEESTRFRQEAADAFSPSMRRRIDMGRLYRQALKQMPKQIDGRSLPPLPAECPFTLDELLGE